MSKRSLEWNEAKYKRYIKEGRGRGNGPQYKPWLTVQDFPSEGRVSRVHGIKTNRVHHLFSDMETRFFYIFDWADEIVDIREQFPLLEVDEVIKIAETLGIKYPCDNESNYPITMTTDFLLTIKREGAMYLVARTVKPSAELDKIRIIEKFEIERRYWLNRNVNWGIITEKELPLEVIKSIQWLHPFYNFEIPNISSENFELLSSQLKKRLKSDLDNSIHKLCVQFDFDYHLSEGTTLSLFRHLAARKEINVDVTKKIELNIPIRNIDLCHKEG